MTAVYLHTFGCKANQYDTETVRQALESVGASVVDDPRVADAAVVNSCTVTHTGEAKMRGLVRRLARMQPDIRTVVMGCAAALDDGAIAALPGVRRVIGVADPAAVLDALDLPSTPIDRTLRRFTRGTRAWLKVQDGCDEHCTFCATTLARGGNRSRPVADVVEEARQLATTTREIVITGVHIGTYGRDRGTALTLGHLMERLISETPGVRFRLSSIEATEVDDQLASLMIEMPDRLAPHIHAPLQSGSDRVLKHMGRHWYTAREYRARIEWLAGRLSTFGLGADVIVGFPGETDRDHRETEAVVRALPFTYAHIFPYSERPGAAARRLGPPAPPSTSRRRAEALRRLMAEKTAAHRAARDGGTADIVLLQRRGGRYEGLTEDYLPVYLATHTSPPPGRFRGKLRAASDGLRAEPVAAA